MTTRRLPLLVALWATAAASATGSAAEAMRFDWFEYTGRDPALARPVPGGSFLNPILAGYYPDPSVTRAGDSYYLVNSSFAHFPGIPIHESTDLVHWRLVGHALEDPAALHFDGLDISRGVFAPAIQFHDGTFYIVNTLVDAGGNFLVTATNPAGPWSAPTWLQEIDGIDPSLFFDVDGKAYILNNGPPAYPPRYAGHRAIWMQAFDTATRKLVGPRKVLVDGGTDLSKQPIWIEGPHLYRIHGWYYLLCAEGGTGPGHSEVVFRARSPWGPFEPFAGNPILTQRDLPAGRADPVTNSGHADLVQMKDGSWWAVFLASRPYAGERYNTGRETFLLPVTWQDGWPLILPHGQPVPYLLTGPRALQDAGKLHGGAAAPTATPAAGPLAGNFTLRDEFDGPDLRPEWLQAYAPAQPWYELARGALEIHPLKVNLDARRNPSFLARRQQHLHFDASTQFMPPAAAGVAAGLAAWQNDRHWYFLGTRRDGTGLQLFLERHAGSDLQVVASLVLPAAPPSPLPRPLRLRISGDGGRYAFYYDAGSGWQPLLENDDASILSTEVAGGFVGTILGPYAREE
jgi:alpha-N-arabinofuranosidase